MNTSRISSGFDIELQLGANWFRTAINLLNDNGLLGIPGVPIIILDVRISFETGFDLEIDIPGPPDSVLASVELNAIGTELIITPNNPQIPPTTIPFGALGDLAEPPLLVKRAGDAEHEAIIGLLANLDIHAESQSEEPKPVGEFLARGNADDAVSFLPLGQDISFGMAKTTMSRFANNIWHTNLREEDGSHPLPDEENKKGSWSKVEMKSENGKIRIKIKGDVPVDFFPDPDVTVTLLITPKIIDGKLTFSIKPETDIDTGLLGDLFAGLTGGFSGGLVGLLVGLFTGGILTAVLIGAAIGAVVAIIVLEIVEVVIEGKVQKVIKAKINGEELADIHCCENEILQIATPNSEEAFDLSFLDSIPTSIAVNTTNPPDELLYKRSLIVTSVYDDLVVDSGGFAISGNSLTDEKFQPEVVSIEDFNYEGDQLVSINYRRSNGTQQLVLIEEVLDRISLAELIPPYTIVEKPEEASLRIPEGKLACVCFDPVAIREEGGVVKEIEFENGLRINVPDAVALQVAGAIVVMGYQLIQPKEYNAYYRAKADSLKGNNFERLPKF